jgi:DNA-directed RNA polymerase subunit F
MGKRPNLSISELKNMLAELKTKTTISSDKSSKVNYSERAKSINQGNVFFLKDQIVKLLKTQGKTSEEIDNILKDMNDNQEKLIAFLYKLKVKK